MKKNKNKCKGSSFDDFLKEEGLFDEVRVEAIKTTLALQLQDAMKQKKITQTDMAKKLGTSRASLKRLLDPKNTSITLHTLSKAATVVGKELYISIE